MWHNRKDLKIAYRFRVVFVKNKFYVELTRHFGYFRTTRRWWLYPLKFTNWNSSILVYTLPSLVCQFFFRSLFISFIFQNHYQMRLSVNWINLRSRSSYRVIIILRDSYQKVYARLKQNNRFNLRGSCAKKWCHHVYWSSFRVVSKIYIIILYVIPNEVCYPCRFFFLNFERSLKKFCPLMDTGVLLYKIEEKNDTDLATNQSSSAIAKTQLRNLTCARACKKISYLQPDMESCTYAA